MFCFWNCSHGMVCFVFGAVLMVWYVLFSILLLVLSVLPYYIVFIKFTRSTLLAQKAYLKVKSQQ